MPATHKWSYTVFERLRGEYTEIILLKMSSLICMYIANCLTINKLPSYLSVVYN